MTRTPDSTFPNMLTSEAVDVRGPPSGQFGQSVPAMNTESRRFVLPWMLALLLVPLTVPWRMTDRRVIPGANVAESPRLLSYAGASEQPSKVREPTWGIQYGKEFWRRPAAPVTPDPKRSQATHLPGKLNVGDVIERVRHALTRIAGESNPAVIASTYTAFFDGKGLILSPHLPGDSGIAGGSDVERENRRPPRFVCRTVAIHHGHQTLYEVHDKPLVWDYEGNVAQVRLNEQAGLVEHYELRSDGAHVSWVFGRNPAGSQAARIVLEAGGMVYAAETEQGHHFADEGGLARVRFGKATAVDAAGHTWPLAVAASQVGSGSLAGASDPGEAAAELRIEIPSSVLSEAEYPLAIDPAIGPEFGLDNPVIGPAFGDQSTPAVASNGAEWLVVWQDSRTGHFTIHGTRVDGDGVVLDRGGIAFGVGDSTQQNPAVAANGTDWLVVWQHDSGTSSWTDVYGARVSQSGTVLDAGGIPISTAVNHQWYPSVASNGSDWLVVWQDARNWNSTRNDVFGARVSSRGTVLDRSGIAVSTAANSQSYPAVAANGTDWLVVWQDARGGGSTDIYGARVNSGGSVLDGEGIPVSTAANHQSGPAVAANGTDWLVVWQDGRTGGGVYGARLNRGGTVFDPGGIPISTTPGFQQLPSVAANGTDWLVVWANDRGDGSNDIYGVRLDRVGSVLDPGGIPIGVAANNQSTPAVAAGGTHWLVVWQDGRSGLSDDVYGARITRAGTVVDAGGIPISTVVNSEYSPAVASNGTDWLVVWADDRNAASFPLCRNIYAVRVNSTGKVLDPGGIVISALDCYQDFPSAAARGADWLVVWMDTRSFQSTSYDIYGARVDPSGKVLDPEGIPVGVAAASQQFPSAAANGDDWLVVWTDDRSGGNWDIYGARVSGTGTVLDPHGLAISAASDNQTFPSVASNGTDWLVVWMDYRNEASTSYDIYGSRVDRSGTVLEREGIAICTADNEQDFPAVAANGTDWLVGWMDYRNGASTGYDIYGARVGRTGNVRDTSGIQISSAPGYEQYPSLAVNGTDWLVVWMDTRSGTAYDIYGARVQSDGLALDKENLCFSGADGNQMNPAAAAVVENTLVVFEAPGETGSPEIHATLFNTAFPTIAAQPESRTNNAGSEAVFAVRATGSTPLSYQWIRDDTDTVTDGGRVSGANKATLTLSNVTTNDTGRYRVLVTNAVGSVSSADADLLVLPALRFDTSPGSLRLDSNGFLLTIADLRGQGSMTLYASTDLLHWDVHLTNPPVMGVLPFVDSGATNLSARFYRATEAP